jgi:hypothetical protein
MRLYFHLVSDFAEVPDTDGVEVRDTSDLRPQILKALEEIRKEKPHLLEEGRGWRVNVADDSGQVLFLLSLDDPADRQWLS